MYNISFMGVDEAHKLKAQGLPAFVAMAVKRSGGRWSELDAEVYYNKVMTEAKLPTETLTTSTIIVDDTDSNEGEVTGDAKPTTGGGSKRNTGK